MGRSLERPSSNDRRVRARGRTLLAGVAAASVSLGMAVAGGHSMPTAAADEPTQADPEPLTESTLPAAGAVEEVEPVKITLITGDTVLYADRGGAMPSVSLELDPESGTESISVHSGPDGVYAIPDQAQPLVEADVLDRELFDVQYLAEHGYTDAEMDALPVIVTYDDQQEVNARSSAAPDASALSARTTTLPATEPEVVGLESINGAGVQVDKESAEDFWNHLDGAGSDARDQAPRPLGADAPQLAAGVEKVWLDGRVTANLDDSLPRIGVPEARERGLDGSGVTVAVLDTGYDAGHPDLAGRVTEARSFVPGEDASDRVGHGTHVASTIAGSGAASDGRYAGVAPGTELMVGKVLAGNFGLDSWVIAGMEWAGANADVVNMSIGSFIPGDGTEPTSRALNRISADTGTLFVVAAGNTGPDASTIGAPAVADSALAVAAVNSDDEVAGFSSRGPRRGDHGLKPDIAAPGTPIVAAWAEGTNPSPGVPVGEHYVAHGGTSMASPHVVGVAAMLVQQHPEWDSQRLKDALMSTSFDAGNGVYEQGAGRVDAARVTGQELVATGKADFGRVPYPAPDEPQSRTITYANTGDADVTVDLALDVEGRDGAVADDVLALSTDTIDVPAGGEAEVDLVLDPARSTGGQFTGHVLGTAGDGTTVSTVVGYTVDAPTHRLTVEAIDRFGGVPRNADVVVQDLNDPDRYYTFAGFDETGQLVLDVPAGDYALHGTIRTSDPGRPSLTYSTDAFATTVVDVDGARSVTVDAQEADDLRFDITSEQRPLEMTQTSYMLHRTAANGERTTLATLGDRLGSFTRFGAVPSAEPPVGDFSMSALTTLREPLIRAEIDAPDPELFTVTPEWTARFDGTRRPELVDVGSGRPEDYHGVDADGAIVLVESGESYVAEQAATARTHGATAMLVMADTPGMPAVSIGSSNRDVLPVLGTTHAEGVRLRERLDDGPVQVTLTGVRESSYAYTLRGEEEGSIRDSLTYTFNRSDLAVVENTFHSAAERRGGDVISAYEEWEGGALRFITNVMQPTVRTDYVSAGPDIRQLHDVTSVRGIGAAQLTSAETAYRPAKREDVSWFTAPNHPTSSTTLPCNLCRSEAILQFSLQTHGDAEPGHSGSGRVGTSYRLYRDGERVERPELMLVPEPATYRIEQTGEARPDDEHLLANRSETTWEFRSEAPSTLEVEGCRDVLPGANACSALPLILLGYDLPLDMTNHAPAGRSFNFEVRTDRAKGYTGPQDVAGMRVSLSFDDGETWEEAHTIPKPRDEGYRVRARHPKLSDTNGYVSLRVEAWDDAGNRTTQTIERAYALS